MIVPWYGRGFYPTTVRVRSLDDGTPITVNFASAGALGIDGFLRLTGGFSAGITLLRAAPVLHGIIGDEDGRRLGDDPLATIGGLVSYRGSVGKVELFGLVGLGVTTRGEERRDRDLTGLFGGGLQYPVGRHLGVRGTVRDQVSSYDAFTSTTNAAPPTTVHELYLSVGPVLRI